MKKTIGLSLFVAFALILVECTDTTPQSTDSSREETTTAESTDTSTTSTAAPSLTSDSDETHTYDMNAEKITNTTTSLTSTTTQTTTMTTTARFPAESDDYGNSDEPHPLNFTYVFTTEGIGLRVEGGNYQTLHYSMSKETAAYLAEHYIIQDCNFDECYDLLLPVQIIGDNTTYLLYLWEKDTLRYCETPVELFNPRFQAEDATVHSRVKGSESISTYEIYQWVGQDVQRLAQYIVNAQTRTVTSTLYDNGTISQHDTTIYSDDATLQAFLNGL